METIDLLFSTFQPSADLSPMERIVLSTNDIAKLSLGTIAQFRQPIRQTRATNPQPAPAASTQAQSNTESLDNTTVQTSVSTANHPITTTHHCWTEDNDDEIEEAPL